MCIHSFTPAFIQYSSASIMVHNQSDCLQLYHTPGSSVTQSRQLPFPKGHIWGSGGQADGVVTSILMLGLKYAVESWSNMLPPHAHVSPSSRSRFRDTTALFPPSGQGTAWWTKMYCRIPSWSIAATLVLLLWETNKPAPSSSLFISRQVKRTDGMVRASTLLLSALAGL